jgi:amino acid transporter
VIGLIVPSNAEVFGASQTSGAIAASPFVQGEACLIRYSSINFLMIFSLAAETLQVRGLPNVVNAALLVFIISAANSDLYITSRTLYSLALLGHAPRIFRKVTRRGVPIWALLISWLFSMLVYLNVAEGSKNGTLPCTFTLYLLICSLDSI